jgi:hypothetical protein
MNVLITGASSGIGLEFSKLFAAQGYDLILVARSAEKLAALAAELGSQHNIHTATLVKNLENPAAPGEIYTELQQRGLQVDILVNNAGYGDHAAFAEADVTRLLNMIQLNVTSLTHLARLFLPGMLARGYGRILNVGSTGSFAPAPYMAVYAATKAFVLSLSEALYEETKNTGVSVTALCPGYTRTEFQATAGVNPKNLMTAEQVARAGYQGLMKGQAIVTPGIQNQLLALSAKWMPRALVRSISAGVVKSIAR